MYGNPAAVSSLNSVNSNGVNSSPIGRNKFSYGLEEGENGEREEREGGRYRFNEEDPGSEDSPLGSPPVVVNGNGSVNGPLIVNVGGQSPEARHLAPLTSPLLTDAGCIRNEDEEEARRKRCGEDEGLPDSVKNLIASSYDPIHKFHQGFLKEVEQRLAQWEGRSNAHIKGDYQRIGDILLKNIQGLRQLTVHLQKHSECLVELERACRSSRKVEAVCRDFEQQRVCYLPLNIFLLRPLIACSTTN
ncbi:hypothetical protein F7725_008955 [Dissostichus mawsoni]|uniref:DH domain-containing protein n=1 Tax=Dissostichus mawsoni TaxID=36200 RepID=A0A7J5Z643_DISMA|nr:hypothetical protein F7725_008955 [Dissostichus mawsoni]